MADTRLYELEECVSPQADDILFIEESATQTDKKVKVSSLMPTDAVEEAVDDWLTAHPEATTTVEDGSITPVKLATSTMDLFDEKANTSGEYDNLTVGSAKQLLSKGYTENKTPYIYRKSAGGDRVYEKLIGGTVAWNQLVVASGSFSFDRDTQRTKNLSTSNVIPVIGHKYFFSMNVVSENLTGSMHAQYGGNLDFTHGTGIKNAIYSASTATPNSVYVYVYMALDEPSGAQATIKDVMVIDLTAMFGTTIADYIYSLEQATAGAGVAYFRQMFPNDYYAYDTGSLQSVNVASKRITRKNQINIADKTLTSSGYVFFLNNLNIVSGTYTFSYKSTYTGQTSFAAAYEDGTDAVNSSPINNKLTFTATKKIVGIRFYGGTGTYSEMQLEFGSTTTPYEPYEEHTYAFDSDLTLRGIPKLDANNNLYYDGDVYESDGTVTRKYGIVDLGSLTWTKASNNSRFYLTLSDAKAPSSNDAIANIVCAMYQSTSFNDNIIPRDKTIAINTQKALSIYDSSYTDAQTFKTALSGVYLVYELATSTTESADAYINPQIVDADGTEEFIDYAQSQGTRDVAVPVGHESKYMINLRAKIEDAVMLPTLPTANGTYTLKCTVASGVPTLSWVAD